MSLRRRSQEQRCALRRPESVYVGVARPCRGGPRSSLTSIRMAPSRATRRTCTVNAQLGLPGGNAVTQHTRAPAGSFVPTEGRRVPAARILTHRTNASAPGLATCKSAARARTAATVVSAMPPGFREWLCSRPPLPTRSRDGSSIPRGPVSLPRRAPKQPFPLSCHLTDPGADERSESPEKGD